MLPTRDDIPSLSHRELTEHLRLARVNPGPYAELREALECEQAARSQLPSGMPGLPQQRKVPAVRSPQLKESPVARVVNDPDGAVVGWATVDNPTGVGREFGPEGLAQYTELKSVYLSSPPMDG